MKICSQCGRELPDADYVKDKKSADGLTGQCKLCRNAKKKEYRDRCQDRIKEYQQKYDHSRNQRKREERENWREDHKEEIAAIKKNRQEVSRIKKNEQRRIKRRDNIEQNRQVEMAAYFKRKIVNIDGLRQGWRKQKHKRRALNRQVSVELTPDQWAETLLYFGHQCAYCGDANRLTQDHIVPLFKGGSYIIGNIIPACLTCNSSKNKNDMNDWYKAQSFFNLSRLRRIDEWVINNGRIDLHGYRLRAR